MHTSFAHPQQKQTKKKSLLLLLHSILTHQDSNYCTTYTTQDSNFTFKKTQNALMVLMVVRKEEKNKRMEYIF